MVSIVGILVGLFFTGIIGAVAWWQWHSYATLDRRIEARDATLIDSVGTRVEKVLDAPQSGVIVPFNCDGGSNTTLVNLHIKK